MYCKMEHSNGKWLAGIIGLIGGMTKYMHMVMLGDTVLLNIIVQPMITGVLTVIASMAAKDLYRWAKIPLKQYLIPWIKSLFKIKP